MTAETISRCSGCRSRDEKHKGLLIVVSGPSGTGKSSLIKTLCEINEDLYLSVSVTTRSPRKNETEGVSYFFRTKSEFDHMLEKGEILEWDLYCGNYYGTPAAYVEEMVCSNKDVLLEITVKGAESVKKRYPDSVLVFILPPSMKALENRIRGRGTESPEVIAGRIGKSRDEMSRITDFDYVVINDDLKEAAEKINYIISAEKLRVARNNGIIEKIQMEDKKV
ncbi:MAG: guanylate kinase [Eubacteriales bacterium]|nr:guanylate kinase [Eubacteriales bacterium]